MLYYDYAFALLVYRLLYLDDQKVLYGYDQDLQEESESGRRD